MQCHLHVIVFLTLVSVSALPNILCFPGLHPKDNPRKNLIISPDSPLPSAEAPTSLDEDPVDNFSADYSVEKECSEDEFWHIRGKNCVPFQCPGGNTKREVNTGKCLYTPPGIGSIRYYGGRRSYGSLSRSYSAPSRTYWGGSRSFGGSYKKG